jgi:hypothetical protein
MVFRSDPVVVEEVTPTTFTFRALPGHFRGEGAKITFSTFRNEHGTLCLRQQAEFEKNWRHIMCDLGSIVLWSLQSARLIYQIRRGSYLEIISQP